MSVGRARERCSLKLQFGLKRKSEGLTITIRKMFDAKGRKLPINCMKRIFRNLAVINTRADTQGTR